MKIRINIFTKLFIAMLIATLSVAVLMGGLVNWSFREGFAGYQQQTEQGKARRLTEILAKDYKSEGEDWAFLKENAYWFRLQSLIGETEKSLPSVKEPVSPFAHIGRSLSVMALGQSMRVINLQGQVIIGPTNDEIFRDAIREAIQVDNREVGWLELKTKSIKSNENDGLAEPAARFLDEQVRNTYFIALFAGLVSLLMAALLVRQLLRPVKQLTAGAKHLSLGHFGTVIQVKSGDELGELARHFNHMALSLQRHETLRSQWIADISHELRTPIAILRSEIEAMLDGVREPTLERIRSLHHDTLSLGQLVNDLHVLALSDSGEMTLLEEWVDVSAVWQDVMDAMESRLAEKRISLMHEQQAADISGQAYLIQGDAKRLYQLFLNLLENSHRYTDEDGTIKSDFSRTGQSLTFTIEDSDPGVPEEALDCLFDRLYRVEQSRSRHLGGSGLGLSICRNIVTLHGGNISADHSDLGGLRICVNLPTMPASDLKETL